MEIGVQKHENVCEFLSFFKNLFFHGYRPVEICRFRIFLSETIKFREFFFENFINYCLYFWQYF
jgi:hypothetical protein